ncbi:unnamed protein product [Rangifer tarandus platyrhynchus]|uniref:Uncharacterized protein n=1 Tax=Rangifer tarandus platyrhynchus TaxID=3082113 RepID=A0AC59ZQ46_RANTA
MRDKRGVRGPRLERVLPHATTSPTLSQAGTQPLDPTALSPPCLPTPGWMGPSRYASVPSALPGAWRHPGCPPSATGADF